MKGILTKKTKSTKDVTIEYKAAEPETYEASRADYKIVGIIGKGAFAKVYGAQCLSKHNRMVAVKVIRLETDDDYGDAADVKPLQISDIQQEAAIMSQLRHENIVSCYASFVVRDELWLVLPFVSGGSVSDILQRSIDNRFRAGIKDENILCCILRDALNGISYMHKQGRIHRDIKGRNILIHGEYGTAMLADFGVAGALLEGGLKKRGRNTMTGTPCWMAPEVMKHQRYNHKADIWSLGITALELAFATTPYTKLKSPMKVMMAIMDGKAPTVDDMDKDNKFSKSFKSFIAKCLIKDPQKRLSSQELLNTDFIKKNARDRAFVIENFVKYIYKIEVKPCHEHDLPASEQKENGVALLRKKSTKSKFQVTVDEADGHAEDVGHDDGDDDDEFRFSTSLHVEDLVEDADIDPDDVDVDVQPDSGTHTQQKGKFMVTALGPSDNSTQQPKPASKFTVTTINGNNGNTTGNGSAVASSGQQHQQSPEGGVKKSRFQVSPIDQ
mmetsp:Transcript_31752/g.51382  ORF Transcript_31752/g.51382 Transcript_31752/m.51382 type:complete len:499 (+) Transcript_31752:49-1545(+)|eukprot:CAMPEP_0202691046 /NCGR_PEP_ID=MMETSP1385-20130828/5868_1 /ASSEMBLY_ACC=CAM_ASM_000861 /TAXON_ID=933848 /ORGANISM="Elphidium margaritaceum" /LENGTH=498 /DNA_ID=CAMNT_0049346389 /DNA_START=45 /DNA_END=1544 /DNA_ORIENTATION=-